MDIYHSRKKVTVFRHHQICQLTCDAIASLQWWQRRSLTGQKNLVLNPHPPPLDVVVLVLPNMEINRKRLWKGISCACKYRFLLYLLLFLKQKLKMDEWKIRKKHRKRIKHFIGLCTYRYCYLINFIWWDSFANWSCIHFIDTHGTLLFPPADKNVYAHSSHLDVVEVRNKLPHWHSMCLT